MPTPPLLDLVILIGAVLAALAMGFAAHQGTTCGVIAMRDLVQKGDPSLLIGFTAASGTATLVCLPAAWLLARGGVLPGHAAIGLSVLAGGSLLAAGALINGACLLGSLWRLGNGELHLIGLVPGVALGHLAAQSSGWGPAVQPNPFGHPSLAGALLIGLGGVLAFSTSWWLWRKGEQTRRQQKAMVVIGLAGGLLFVLQPRWTWSDAISDGAAIWLMPFMVLPTPAWHTLVAAIAGSLASGWLVGALRPRWSGWTALIRSLLGGAIMAFGAYLIPGGNDALLLGGVPAGAMSALIGFGVMNLVILVFELASSPARRSKVS